MPPEFCVGVSDIGQQPREAKYVGRRHRSDFRQRKSANAISEFRTNGPSLEEATRRAMNRNFLLNSALRQRLILGPETVLIDSRASLTVLKNETRITTEAASARYSDKVIGTIGAKAKPRKHHS